MATISNDNNNKNKREISMDNSLKNKNILILAANGFAENDMTQVQRVLTSNGVKPTVVSPDNGLINGWNGTAWGHHFPVDSYIGEVLSVDYDVVICLGGERSVATLLNNPHTNRILNGFVLTNKQMVMMSESVKLLSGFEDVKNWTIAGLESDKDAMIEAGATWSDENFNIDGFLMTGNAALDTENFISAMVEHVSYVELEEKLAA